MGRRDRGHGDRAACGDVCTNLARLISEIAAETIDMLKRGDR
jgi:hypothetical protein